MYRCFLGQRNCLQSMTQFHCCHNFSSCTSMTTFSTVEDVRPLNKLTRQIKSQSVKFQICLSTDHWECLDFLMPLTETTMITFHQKAWQCSWQLRASDWQWMVLRMEIWWRLCSPLPWRNCIPSWSALNQTSFSVHCGWTHRWNCKHWHEDWCEESVTTARTIHLSEKRNHPHDFYVAKGNLFRNCSWSCSHSCTKLLDKLPHKGFSQDGQYDHIREDKKLAGCWHSSWFQNTCGTQSLLFYLVQSIYVHKWKGSVLPEHSQDLFCTTTPPKKPFQVMFVGTQQTREQK